MALYSSAEIKAKIEVLDAKISKAETAQEYGAGVNVSLRRGDLDAMYRQRERWIKLYEEVAAQEAGTGNTGLVQFGVPS
jgi:hypothetical protein